VLEELDGSKLGAAALAALAILESPDLEDMRTELAMLAESVVSMQDDERGFRTFFEPAGRDGQHWNFYAGEALLFLAAAARDGLAGMPSFERLVALFHVCQRLHLQKPNPAFVPWQTQAGAILHGMTGDASVARAVLEMNDWLLPMQRTGGPPWASGCFYLPDRPEFGPPHTSSTGVYLEGLADAAALADRVGETRRAAAYRTAIARGFRSLRQWQFSSDEDLRHAANPGRARGAIRTEAYSDIVRIDNAGHALAAAVKAIEAPAEWREAA